MIKSNETQNDFFNTRINEWQYIRGKGHQFNKHKGCIIPLQNRFDGFLVDEPLINDDDDDDKSYDTNKNPTNETNVKFRRHDNNSFINNNSRIYTNNNPERDILPSKNAAKPYNNYVAHTNVANKKRKIAIISASITKPINMIQFNRALKNGDAIKRPFGGATASQLNHYVQAILHEDKPDTIIINGGTNNLTKKKNQTVEETAMEIINIVKTCRSGGVKRIYVSSITCRPSHQAKIDKINELLQYYAGIYRYEYIDNACIKEGHLKRDGVHLNYQGTCLLANNFLSHLNNYLLPFESIWD